MIHKSLSACLIVKNEEVFLPTSLASIEPFVDEIVVYDTGSSDSTIEVAKDLGAIVVSGWWNDDFASARNRALEHIKGDWVLSIDADELLIGDPPGLRSLISSLGNENLLSLTARYRCTDELRGDFDSPAIRIFKRGSSLWRGSIHEELVEHEASSLPLRSVGFETAHILDLSYQDPKATAAKAERNIAICKKELANFDRSRYSDADYYRLKLQLARSLVGAHRGDEAIETLSEIEQKASKGIIRQIAIEFLARIHLDRGSPETVLSLAEELKAVSSYTQYADWLAAQALVKLGRYEKAYQLIRPLSFVIDSQMHNYGIGKLEEMKGLISGICNREDEAIEHLSIAVFDHGLASGNLGILLGLVSQSRPKELLALTELIKSKFPVEFQELN
ncbi:MAG: glycosyltransferase family 2 protein [Acidimicrobiaceae bacterium]|nr:glycosyltransferase family 2 protein [Acidimicrobiaceae bacterium]